jgi:hypothetical protein
MINVWDSTINSAEEALSLPEGKYISGIGIEQQVERETTLEAATAIINGGLQVKAATQARIIVKAQERGVAFQDWTPLRM